MSVSIDLYDSSNMSSGMERLTSPIFFKKFNNFRPSQVNTRFSQYPNDIQLPMGSMLHLLDNFENLNTDPYEVDPDELPFSAQFKEPFSYVYAPQQNLFQYCFNLNIDLLSGYFMTPHNFNGSGNVDYALNRGFCGGMYENVYLHIFNNTRRLIASCDEQGLSDYGAMMRVVQAYAIQMLTDAYGPVAYSSVIEDPTGGASFSYDTQESVYKALFTLVDEAIAGFKGTASVADMQAFD